MYTFKPIEDEESVILLGKAGLLWWNCGVDTDEWVQSVVDWDDVVNDRDSFFVGSDASTWGYCIRVEGDHVSG